MPGKAFDWVVIGAGPAGIATIGKLLDHKIPHHKIGWIDLAFRVGDLGEKWHSVSSNTTVELFIKFLNASSSFGYKNKDISFTIDGLEPQGHCLLKEVVEPLQWITDQLLKKVKGFKEKALALNLKGGYWEIQTLRGFIQSKNVVLATGSEPKQLHSSHAKVIPLEVALNPSKLKDEIDSSDIVGVYGASHSSILVLANLIKLNPKLIFNFYRSAHRYAVKLDDWILFDNTGLKGFAKNWAIEHLDGLCPKILKRLHISDPEYEEKLAICNKVIYPIGFEPRKVPVLEQFPGATYQETTGIIAPGVFGVGIAFPQAQFDPLGSIEYRVGLWKFMDYLNSILPIWKKYSNK